MATRTDITVVTSAYDTSGNGGRKLVRLSNGWIVAALKTGTGIYIYKSTDNGSTWTKLVTESTNPGDLSVVAIGNSIGLLRATAGAINYSTVDIVNDVVIGSYVAVDPSLTAVGNVSLAINDAGTELHAAWASKNSTYPNSYNIRYAKGTISGDGSVSWGAVQQINTWNVAGKYAQNPCVIVVNGKPVLFYEEAGSANGNTITVKTYNGTDFNTGLALYSNATYTQQSPSALFVPQGINGLANGRVHVSWHGMDATDTTKNNIRHSYSDDGGVTWSTPAKVTSGNTYGQSYPTLAAYRNGKVFVSWQGLDAAISTGVGQIRQSEFTTSWSAPTSLTNVTTANCYYPNAMVDFNISATAPLFIYMNNQSNKIGFYGTWTVTTISVTPGTIGTKSDKSNVLTYTITTDGTMGTITESINGIAVNTRNVASGTQVIAGLTQAQWDAIKYGKYKDATGGLNTLTVSMGLDTWTYTFDKRLATGDDVLSAVKAVQDSQTAFLPSVKVKLGGAIRGKGGTVNDTDSWETMVSAVNSFLGNGYTGGKRWASGTSTGVNGTLTISGLGFTPTVVVGKSPTASVTNSTITYANKTVLGTTADASIYTANTANAETITATPNSSGIVLNSVSISSNTYKWIAFE
jgi:hypothetical protein